MERNMKIVYPKLEHTLKILKIMIDSELMMTTIFSLIKY
jgi:hypothetical protein